MTVNPIQMTVNPIRVVLANRCAGSFWSIEELFRTISGSFPVWVDFIRSEAPGNRVRLRALLANLRWAASLKNCDVLHQTGDIHYAVLGVWNVPAILTIHDLRFIDEARGLKRLLFWLLWLYLPCLRAKRVTVISQFTKNRLLEICRLNPKKVRVIPNCVGSDFVAMAKPWSTRRIRILLVGTTENKNLSRVCEAFAGMNLRLSILGRLSYLQKTGLEEFQHNYDEHTALNREEVVTLYQSCDLVVFVSTYEGFGMPILEAQAVGRPVLTSDISPMKEVAGEGALLVDPFDVSAIRSGLVQLIEDAKLREDLVEKGFRNVANYSAESVAAQYADLYKEVIGEQ